MWCIMTVGATALVSRVSEWSYITIARKVGCLGGGGGMLERYAGNSLYLKAFQ